MIYHSWSKTMSASSTTISRMIPSRIQFPTKMFTRIMISMSRRSDKEMCIFPYPIRMGRKRKSFPCISSWLIRRSSVMSFFVSRIVTFRRTIITSRRWIISLLLIFICSSNKTMNHGTSIFEKITMESSSSMTTKQCITLHETVTHLMVWSFSETITT